MDTKKDLDLDDQYSNWLNRFLPTKNTFRPVLMKRWIQAEFEKGVVTTSSYAQLQKPGTGIWTKEFETPGYFQDYGVAYEEIQNGSGGFTPAPYTVAVIEMMDGTVETVLLSNFKFAAHESLNKEEREEIRQKFITFAKQQLQSE